MTLSPSKPEQPAPPPPAPLQVVEWLISGATESQVAEALAVKYPGTDPGSTMTTVQGLLRQAGNPDRDCLTGWALLSLRSLYSKLLATGDYDAARKAISEIMKLAP